MLQTPLEIDKEILGYQLRNRIGAGGFGEVWSAEAPGGLMKAVKVVFGFHDGKRAQAELKALDRVKELRHPFLLSLERIEVFNSQLVVVSELADCSLADKFNEQIAAGKCGIDRDEMLRYMRCAAEALDYLSDSHGLQHLDIKPENLLLVGEHVKVADFGLIKDLGQASQSLMSGMTPAYAAPELFDGRPGKFSDQYSLAIVYQEMLTGHRPFSGSTPAQLAAQHTSGRPNISSLPSSDQSIIAKALAKDPSCRFGSCCEFVDELCHRRRTKKKTIRRRVNVRMDEDSNTMALPTSFGDNQTRDVTAIISGQSLPFQAAQVKVLDPPEACASDSKVRPMLILGVGATGSKIVKKIKTQFVSQHGSMEKLPSIKLMAIDTSLESLDELVRSGAGQLSSSEIVSTPLKKAEVYRSQKKSHLGWLSRRWIYNIPRSLQSEGLRPLGRLAYADHFDTLYERLEKSIREITHAENLALTADTLDIDPGELNPRVFIVTSISGGIGSGMALDLSYMARLLLHECGFEPDAITGILTHSTYRRNRDPGLSAANAFAFLTELRHFHDHGYPGDTDNGVPEFEDVAPFDYTYFDDLGDDLCQSEFDQRLENIAEYLMLAGTSKCASFFDQCHDFEADADHFSLRTFGVSVTGPGKLSAGVSAAANVSKKLLKYWASGDDASEQQALALVETITNSHHTSIDKIDLGVEHLHGELFSSTLVDVQASFVQQVQQSNLDANQVAALFDSCLTRPLGRPSDGCEEPEASQSMLQGVKDWALETGEAVVASIQETMDDETLNLAVVSMASQKFVQNFKDGMKQCESRSVLLEQNERQQLERLANLSLSRSKGKPTWAAQLDQEVNDYLQTRVQLAVCRFTRVFLRTATASVESLGIVLDQQRRQIETVAKDLQSAVEMLDDQESAFGGSFSLEALLNESIQSDVAQHVSDAEKLVYESLISKLGGYREALKSSSIWQGTLRDEVLKQSHRVLAEAYKKVSLDKVLQENHVQPEVFAKWLNDRMQEARPRVNDCGGGTRLLIGMPSLSNDTSLKTMVENHFGVEGCPVNGTEGSFVVCFEGEGIGLANVAFRLLQARPDAIELVKRIHTRTDIQWTTLDDLL